MKYQDIIVILIVVAILGLIIYFNFIRPKLRHESPCCKCAYSNSCKDKKAKNKDCNK